MGWVWLVSQDPLKIALAELGAKSSLTPLQGSLEAKPSSFHGTRESNATLGWEKQASGLDIQWRACETGFPPPL